MRLALAQLNVTIGDFENTVAAIGGHLDADTCVRVGTLSIEVPDAPGPMILTLELTGADLPVGPVLRSDASHIVRP